MLVLLTHLQLVFCSGALTVSGVLNVVHSFKLVNYKLSALRKES